MLDDTEPRPTDILSKIHDQDSRASLHRHFLGASHYSSGNLTWGFWADLPRSAMIVSIQESLGTAFARLKSLSMTSWMGSMGAATDPSSPISRFVAFLTAAPLLEIFEFEVLHVTQRETVFQVELHSYVLNRFSFFIYLQIRNHSWSNLSSLPRTFLSSKCSESCSEITDADVNSISILGKSTIGISIPTTLKPWLSRPAAVESKYP